MGLLRPMTSSFIHSGFCLHPWLQWFSSTTHQKLQVPLGENFAHLVQLEHNLFPWKLSTVPTPCLSSNGYQIRRTAIQIIGSQGRKFPGVRWPERLPRSKEVWNRPKGTGGFRWEGWRTGAGKNISKEMSVEQGGAHPRSSPSRAWGLRVGSQGRAGMFSVSRHSFELLFRTASYSFLQVHPLFRVAPTPHYPGQGVIRDNQWIPDPKHGDWLRDEHVT